MSNPESLANARSSFETSLLALSARDENAATVILTLARLAADEMVRNTEFASAATALSSSRTVPQPPTTSDTPIPPTGTTAPTRRTRTARTPAVLDPFQVLRSDGQDGLATRLGGLDLEQLRDIIHQYGMDPDRRAMKWKTISKVRERIVERALSTSSRDNAFR